VVRGVAVIGPAPRPDRVDTFEVRSNGRRVATLRADVILVANTSLRAVRPRVMEMGREAFATMLQAVCEETNIWPLRHEE
jgi:hypothetical protein